MDFSALTEAQQQQLIAQHQQQTQQQQQPADQSQQASQPYDPSQAYDQTAQAYYYPQSYQNPASQSHQQYLQQNPYPYYPPEYANASANNSYQQPSQQDSNIQPPGISVSQEASQNPGAGGNTPAQQNAYYPQEQQNSSYPVPPGLNPAAAAAVAALSQLTQFAGSMDAAERAMAGVQEPPAWPGKNEGGYGHMAGHHQPHPQHHPGHHGGINFRPPPGRISPYRGGGRRGGGPFRGGGRGNFGHHHPRPDGGAPHFRGSGRLGRGGGRRFSQPSSASPSPYPAPTSENPSAPSAAPAVTPPTRMKSLGQAQAPSRPLPLVAWCELCMVDCNSLEILEQHRNGKRHKKNVQRYEELQNHKKLMAEAQAKAQEQSQNLQMSEENKAPSQENLPVAAATDENRIEMDRQNQTTEQPKDAKVRSVEAPVRKRKLSRRLDPRRKMKYNRRRKRRKMLEERKKAEPDQVPAPKESPKYCALCRVTCDTQAVYDSHLAGKKHTSRAKRSQGSSICGLDLHAVYMPHGQPAVNPVGNNQQAIHDPQGQELQGLSLTSYENHQAQQDGLAEGQEIIAGPEDQNAGAVQPEGQNVTLQPDGQVAAPAQLDSESAAVVKPGGQDVVTVQQEDQNAVTVQPEDQMDVGGKPEDQMDVGGKPEGHNGIAVKSEGQDAVTVETTDPNAIALNPDDPNTVSETGTKEFSVTDNSIHVSENTKIGAELVFSSTDDAVLAPESGVSSSKNVFLPGLQIEDEGPGPNEEPTTQDMASQ